MGVVPLFGVGSEYTTEESTLELRVPGMTETFTIALCPGATIETETGPVEIPSLYVLTTELTWDLYDIYVYKLDEPEEDTKADAISRPSKPYVPPDRGFGHDGYPAIGMTRHAAQGFCEWLSLKSGLEVRLPSADEWSYLASPDASDEPLDKIAWFADNAEHTTHPVSKKQPNRFGLFDMQGNAAEWVMTDTRKPIAYGGSYRDDAESCTVQSSQKEVSAWNQSDPQIPKSKWWLADCSWVGFRFVIDAKSVDPRTLEELMHVADETD